MTSNNEESTSYKDIGTSYNDKSILYNEIISYIIKRILYNEEINPYNYENTLFNGEITLYKFYRFIKQQLEMKIVVTSKNEKNVQKCKEKCMQLNCKMFKNTVAWIAR